MRVNYRDASFLRARLRIKLPCTCMKQVQRVTREALPRLPRIWLLFRGDDQRSDGCSDLHSSNPSLFGICVLNIFWNANTCGRSWIFMWWQKSQHHAWKLGLYYELCTSTSISLTVEETPMAQAHRNVGKRTMDNFIFGCNLLNTGTDIDILLGRTLSYGNGESYRLQW